MRTGPSATPRYTPLQLLPVGCDSPAAARIRATAVYHSPHTAASSMALLGTHDLTRP